MFGYVRPLKPELLMREFTRYKSIYCGICKQIGHDYGQLPRVGVNYDLTMLAVLLLSLSQQQPTDEVAGCILNPLAKRPIARGGEVLELCAGLTVLFAWYKAVDDVADEHSFSGRIAKIALKRSYRRAVNRFPAYDRWIASAMNDLRRLEFGPPDPAASNVFGGLLSRIFSRSATLVCEDEPIRQAIGLLGGHLGCWIYLMDAIDDWTRDCNNGSWNPYGGLDLATARAAAGERLADLELEMDRTAALLPYRRDGGLIANIFTLGLPDTRQRILRGEKPTRL